MEEKIVTWLSSNKDRFPRIAADYYLSMPTLYDICLRPNVKRQKRIIDALKLAYKERGKKK